MGAMAIDLGAEPRAYQIPQPLGKTASIMSRAAAKNATRLSPINVADYATALNGINGNMDHLFKVLVWWTLGVLGMLILVTRLYQRWRAHIRHLAAMNLSKTEQVYFSKHQSTWNWKFKKYITYAPLKNKRHNREIRLSSAINMGTVPSRFQTIVLGAFLLSNIAYTLAVDWANLNRYAVAAEMRGRTGVLSVINMFALIIFAGRNNPLIGLLQISFDTYNLLHRWIGRVVILEAVIHTACWAYVKHVATGWKGVADQLVYDSFAGWGFIGTVALALMLLLSLSPVRHAFYETFLDIHIILAAAAMIGIYVHCAVANLPQFPYIKIIMALWAGDRFLRMARLVRYNYSRADGWTSSTIEALSDGASRVTLHLPRKVDVKPGCHAYLRFGSIKPWESHPFSIAWVEHKPLHDVLPSTKEGIETKLKDCDTVTDISFVIHAQTGMTKRLYDKAAICEGKRLTLRAGFEGPYGGHHSLDSYGHAVLFAGSSGITHQIPFIRHLIACSAEKSVATRKITLVWIVRDADHLEWVRPWMDIILRMPNRRECLTIKLFVTRPRNPAEIRSPSNTVQMFPGRPNVKLLMQAEAKEQVGAMCVTVCGPGGLADNVREAVREVQEHGVVDFIEESFTW